MRHRQRSLGALAMGVVLCCAASALAELSTEGDPIEEESWSMNFKETGHGAFDLVAVRMASDGDTFQTPTLRDFRNKDLTVNEEWALLNENEPKYPTLASASGSSSVTWLRSRVKFFGNNNNALAFDWVAFNGETVVNTAHASWGGVGNKKWTIVNYGTDASDYWNPTRAAVAPVPGALLLGAIGLGVVAWVRKRLA